MIPTWISNLKDPALKADFTAFANAGPITEAELAKAFADVAFEGGATLSASQFADLQAIAAHLPSLGASDYLQFITNAFVNGNPANQSFTGGGAPAKALGNLGPGYSMSNYALLVGKWFMGTDLPSDQLQIATNNTVSASAFSYAYGSAPLYGASGPVASDIHQGALGDCFLLSSLAEIAHQNPNAIRSMIADNGNGTYGVRFYWDGQARYVTVDAELPNGGTLFQSGPDLWAGLVEKAYAQAQTQGLLTGKASASYGNSYSTIGNGGLVFEPLEEITDASVETGFQAGAASWTRSTGDRDFNQTSLVANKTSASVLAEIAADLLVGNDVVLASFTDATDASGLKTLVSNHAFSIYGFDAYTGELDLRNPWGASPNANYRATFELSLNALLNTGDYIVADNLGSATTVSGASVVAAAGLQAMSQIASFSVADSVANVAAAVSQLEGETKLASLTVSGSTGNETLDLSGLSVTASIDMGGNSDQASIVLTKLGISPSAPVVELLDLGAGYDMLTLGSGATTVSYALGGAGGVEEIANFSAARDLLSVALNGATLEQTLVSGGDWISSTADATHGVFLSGVTSLQSFTASGGVAKIA